MIVAKFGGTSVSSFRNIETICSIVKAGISKKPVLVVSALSGVTDLLLSLPRLSKTEKIKSIQSIKEKHYSLIESLVLLKEQKNKCFKFIDEKIKEILKQVQDDNVKVRDDKEILDKLASYGEIMSSFIIAEALNSKDIKAKQIIATDIITTNDSFGSAEFILEPTLKNTRKILMPIIKKGVVPVVTGFIGKTKSGKITTLGRGGSDYSASIIGFCIKAREIHIWTDVDGMYTADPRFVKNANLLSYVSFREASELATFGAKILHPRTIKPAIEKGIPVRVLNTFNPENRGTLIVNKPDFSNPITAISCKRKITLVNIYSTEMLYRKGFLVRIFEVFSKNDISIDLVSVSEVSISVTLDNVQNLANAVTELSRFAGITTTKDLGIVSLVGDGIVTSHKIIHKIFDILDNEGILVKMVSLGATDINVSLVVQNDQLNKAVRVLHDKLLMRVRGKLNGLSSRALPGNLSVRRDRYEIASSSALQNSSQ